MAFPRPLVHLLGVDTEGDELLVLRPWADSEIEAATREVVEDGCVLGHSNGVVEGQQRDRGSDPEVLGSGGNGGRNQGELINKTLTTAPISDPDIDNQALTAQRALRELSRVRQITINAGGRNIGLITRRSPLQTRILAALGVDTRAWDTARLA